MRIQTLIAVFLLAFLFVACGNNKTEKNEDAATIAQEQEALLRKLIDEGYIPFVGTQYEMHISEEEAAAKGINAETYRKMLQMLEEGNKMIRGHIEECKNDTTTQMMILNGDTLHFDKKPE